MSTKIEWCDDVINPILGCKKHSDGCKNCYAKPMHKRLSGNPKTPQYHKGFDNLVFYPEALKKLDKMKKPKRIFVGSMSDIFQEGVRFSWQDDILFAMAKNSQHTYQLLTKRPENMLKVLNDYRDIYGSKEYEYPKNEWYGVTIESDKYLDRLKTLKQMPCKSKFISFEPLLSNMPKLDLSEIGWVIVGGESGQSNNVRPMKPKWVRDIRDMCKEQNVSFFFKQWGKWIPECQLTDEEKGKYKKVGQYLLDGIRFYAVGKKAKNAGKLDGIEYKEFPSEKGDK